MNSAFLLVATAWLAAGDPAPIAAAPAIVSAPAACSGGSCGAAHVHGGACCDTCCDDCCKESFLQRLFGRFRRHDDCCQPACDTCCTTTHVHAAPCCDTCCDDCCKESFLQRLFGRFRRHNDCCCQPACGCDSGCANGSCGSAYHGAPIYQGAPGLAPAPGGAGLMPKAEQVPAPKDGGKDPGQPLPKGDKKEDKSDKISAPALDGAPAAPKALEGDARSPF